MEFGAGNIGFMLVATALVMIMTPGLAFFYGGLVGSKNVVAVMMHSFVSLGVSTLLWYVVGFSLSFSGGEGWRHRQPRLGIPQRCFSHRCMVRRRQHSDCPLLRISDDVCGDHACTHHRRLHQPDSLRAVSGVPGLVAALGLLSICSHDLGRRPARRLGSSRFRGEASSSTPPPVWPPSGPFCTWGAGRASEKAPHNIPFIALGMALLWFGWFGFNAGSELAADEISIVAFVNTQLAAAIAALTWMVIEWRREGQPKLVGLLTGAIAGLATITPRRRVRRPGLGCHHWTCVRNGLLLRGPDQGEDGVGMTPSMCGRCTASVASSASSCSGSLRHWPSTPAGADGLINGGGAFFGKQVVAVLGAGFYALAITYAMLAAINRVSPVKTSQSDEETGLDEALHGETAYI